MVALPLFENYQDFLLQKCLELQIHIRIFVKANRLATLIFYSYNRVEYSDSAVAPADAACPPPFVPAGHWPPRCSDGYEVGSVCSYSCPVGYTFTPFVDRPLSTCHANGEWLPPITKVFCDRKSITPQTH